MMLQLRYRLIFGRSFDEIIVCEYIVIEQLK